MSTAGAKTSRVLKQSLLARVVKRVGAQRMLDALDAEQREALLYMWRIIGRPAQFAPAGDWRWWLNRAGRGFGKTRGGAEWVREQARLYPGCRIGIGGKTPAEVRAIQIEGPSGLLACCPANERPEWEPSKGELRWPNGTVGIVFSGAEPGSARGPQFHRVWIDELAKMPRAGELFDNVNMGLRLEYVTSDGRTVQPQGIITTTPRPTAIMRDLAKRRGVVVTGGSTFDNAANLARSFIDDMRAYEGTRLGRQELHGEQLDDTPGALWTRAMFDRAGFRRRVGDDLKSFSRISIAIDPAASNNEDSDETGIIAGGVSFAGSARAFHVLRDVSISGTPQQRARAAILCFIDLEADDFVVETNNGGDWIPALIEAEWRLMQQDERWRAALPGRPKVVTVTATRGKAVRAEPIAALYESPERLTVTHEPGLEVLEDQLVTWSPLLNEKSPDRLDALVWLLTHLSTAKAVLLV